MDVDRAGRGCTCGRGCGIGVDKEVDLVRCTEQGGTYRRSRCVGEKRLSHLLSQIHHEWAACAEMGSSLTPRLVPTSSCLTCPFFPLPLHPQRHILPSQPPVTTMALSFLSPAHLSHTAARLSLVRHRLLQGGLVVWALRTSQQVPCHPAPHTQPQRTLLPKLCEGDFCSSFRHLPGTQHCHSEMVWTPLILFTAFLSPLGYSPCQGRVWSHCFISTS
jgi:hypothetical protein